MNVLAYIIAASILVVLSATLGAALQRLASRDAKCMMCSAGHIWWVRRDDAKAYGKHAAQCPWCRAEP